MPRKKPSPVQQDRGASILLQYGSCAPIWCTYRRNGDAHDANGTAYPLHNRDAQTISWSSSAIGIPEQQLDLTTQSIAIPCPVDGATSIIYRRSPHCIPNRKSSGGCHPQRSSCVCPSLRHSAAPTFDLECKLFAGGAIHSAGEKCRVEECRVALCTRIADSNAVMQVCQGLERLDIPCFDHRPDFKLSLFLR